MVFQGDKESLSDADLLLKIKDGDTTSFQLLYNRHIDKIYSYANSLNLEADDAEDCIQEVFTSLWHRRANLQVDNLGAWLFMALKKQMLFQLRKKKYQDQYVDQIVRFVSPFYDPVLDTLQEKQLQEYLEVQIQQLSPRMQEVFRLSRIDQMSHKEIAAQLQISELTVKKQINSVLKIFKHKLGYKSVEALIIIFYLLDKK